MNLAATVPIGTTIEVKSVGAELMENAVECVDGVEKKTAMRTDDAVIVLKVRDGGQTTTEQNGAENRDIVMKNGVGKM